MRINESKDKSLNLISGTFNSTKTGIRSARMQLNSLNMGNDKIEEDEEENFPQVNPAAFLDRKQEQAWNHLPEQKRQYYIRKGIAAAEHAPAEAMDSKELFSDMFSKKEHVGYMQNFKKNRRFSRGSFQENDLVQLQNSKYRQGNLKAQKSNSRNLGSDVDKENIHQQSGSDLVQNQAGITENTNAISGIFSGSQFPSMTEKGLKGTADNFSTVSAAPAAAAAKAGKKAAEFFKNSAEAYSIGSSQYLQSKANEWRQESQLADSIVVKGGAALAATVLAFAATLIQMAVSLVSSLISALIAVSVMVLAIVSVIGALAALIISLGTSSQSTSAGYNLPGFVTEEMMEAFFETQEEYGIPVSSGIAQLIGESGFGLYGPGGESGQGLSSLAYDYKNLFGIKYESGDSYAIGAVNMATGEQTATGESYEIVDAFSVYANYADSIRQRAWKLMREPYYSQISPYLVKDGVEYTKADADNFIGGIRAGGWATSISYVTNCIDLMTQYNLYQFDNMTYEEYQAGLASGGGNYNGTVTPMMQKIADIAKNNQGLYGTEENMCAAWVTGVYQAAGAPVIPWGDAIDMWNTYQFTGSTSMDNIPPGAIVCGSGSGDEGALYGHVGIYIGDGLVANNKGCFEIETLEQWCSWQDAMCQGHVGWIGWVFPGGVPSE